jgi:hypothetical protein
MKTDPQAGTHRSHSSEYESVRIVCETIKEASYRAAGTNEPPGAARQKQAADQRFARDDQHVKIP